jgi:hypothetical protein
MKLHYTCATAVFGRCRRSPCHHTPVLNWREFYAANRAQRVFEDIGATAGLRSCAVDVVQATELLALDLFNSGARQITIDDVECHVRRLRGHPAACPCGRCSAATIVRPDRVLMNVRRLRSCVPTAS